MLVKLGDSYFDIESEFDGRPVNIADCSKAQIEKIKKTGAWVSITRKRKGLLFDRLSKIIDRFADEMMAAGSSEEEKLTAIAKCVNALELTHPFEDANCRTMVLLLNKLLIQNGFSPTILTNPNRIDAYSIEEIVEEVKLGQIRFAEQCQNALEEDVSVDMNAAVLYLNNSSMARLLVLQAVADIDDWSYINIADREIAIEAMTKQIQKRYEKLSTNEIAPLKEFVVKKLSASIYKKSFYQLTSRHALFYQQIGSDLVRGEFSKVRDNLTSQNRLGIDMEKLDDGKGYLPTLDI